MTPLPQILARYLDVFEHLFVRRTTTRSRSKNIYWAVDNLATLDTSSVFKGTIMAYSSIAITTGAELDGRALAQVAAVTVDTNTQALQPIVRRDSKKTEVGL